MHHLTTEAVAELFGTNISRGISHQEVRKRLGRYGLNAIPEEKQISDLVLLLNQFKSPIVYLLVIAAGLSFFFSEHLDGLAILLVLMVNTLIGFYMEFRARRSMKALRDLSRIKAKVIREEKLQEVPAEEIVPGDILYLEAGDMVVADARIVSCSDLQMEEAALTGESLPVEKSEKSLSEDTPLAERSNMLFKGTFVNSGNGKAIVTATGMQTELGRIAGMIRMAREGITPLEKKLQGFSKVLIRITLGIIVLVFIATLLYGYKIANVLQTCIALAVATIPEGLPIVATLALANGMIKMARNHIIVKKLAAVETLGSTNIICTDKTGTLTQNKITVERFLTPECDVSPGNIPDIQVLNIIIKASALCNTAEVREKQHQLQEIGDPLETALLKFVQQEGQDVKDLRRRFPKIAEIPFSSEKRLMATAHIWEKNEGEAEVLVFAKGAPEELIHYCTGIYAKAGIGTFSEDDQKNWIEKAEKLSASGLRVIAFAYKHIEKLPKSLLEELSFLGLCGMADPLREGVAAAIRECQSAGIKVVMLTGDHEAVAKNIGLQLGLISSEDAPVISGSRMSDYEVLTDAERNDWKSVALFARVSPKQKFDLLKVLQEDKNIVAMTGDGINDAPALKKADIGIAMGKRGTQVAQEVSDMILKDDTFNSIVFAIREGRIIFKNIRKFVLFLLSCNLSELLIIASSAVLNLWFQLVPLQILFINLITDVLPALALGVGAGSASVMEQAPGDPQAQLVGFRHWISLLIYAIIMTVFSVGAVFFNDFVLSPESRNTLISNNILFFTLIITQLLHVYNMTEGEEHFFRSEVFTNRYVWYANGFCALLILFVYFIPPVRRVLHIYELSFFNWLTIIFFSLGASFVIHLFKKINVVL